MKILIIRYGNIGDVLLDTPLIRETRRVFKLAKIYYLTRLKTKDILDENPYVEEVVVRERYNLFDLIRHIKSQMDTVFDLQHNAESMLITTLSGARIRVSIERKKGNFPYNFRVNPDFREPYTVYHRLSLLIPFGYKNSSLELEFPIPPKLINGAKRWLNERGGFLNIAIHTVTGNKLKDWPLKNYALIADKLVDEFNAKIFFLWDKNNLERVKDVFKFSHYRHELAPSTNTLKKLAAFLNVVDLYFGADSGPKHIAVSQNTPTFTIFTHTEPKSWTPPSDPAHDYISKGLTCQPCWAKGKCPLRTYSCLLELNPEEVYSQLENHIRKLLKSR